MKFIYEYRTSDNVRHAGEIAATDQRAAYVALKAKGIRPSRLTDAPGFFNALLGKGKRWLAIAALLVLVGVLVVAWSKKRREASRLVADEAYSRLYEDRSQLYGDPVVIAEANQVGWANVFMNVGDRYLAYHAIPGRKCGCGKTIPAQVVEAIFKGMNNPVPVDDDDLAEIAQMKRMVNGMKLELQEYVKAGGSVSSYLRRMEIRQRAEVGILERVHGELQRSNDTSLWKKKNAELRAMGLPMVAIEPESEPNT